MSRRLHDLSEDSEDPKVLQFKRPRPSGSEPPEETFASYFARYQIARHNFQWVDVPELRPLAAVCTYVLVRSDGLSFEVIAIVDRDARPNARFTLSALDVHEIGKTCAGYTGEVNGNKIPVHISIYEIGGEGDANEAIDRLRPLHDDSTITPVKMNAWLLDTETKRVWTNMRLAWLGWKQSIERLLNEPRAAAADLEPPALAINSQSTLPYFTGAFAALLVVLFGMNVVQNPGIDGWHVPMAAVLHDIGGLSRQAVVEQGQWWRLFTAPLLHANLVHLILNVFALGLIGMVLEVVVGWRWTMAGLAASAIGGAIASILVGPANMVSVGASGGIIGLYALQLVLVRRLPYGSERTQILLWTIGGLVPALLPLANGITTGAAIDYGAHFGGAIAGGVLGLVVLRLWPPQLVQPKWSIPAALLGATWCALCIGSIVFGVAL